ncbi:MAG TPA: TIGR03564 family F420-dependent LLM class oxidoreductase [Acidimicrobiales bacterium]|nr:TIGR03564 family F420-dependent LLM class oxidoreductase [Acidimicrobiales bacterium]
MRIGLQLRSPLSEAANVLDALIDTAQRVQRAGLASLWLAQAYEFDAMIALALIGRAGVDLELGTAVIPTYPRHPLVLAQEALTVQVACRNRFVLGIGPSHREVIENVYGMSFEGVARHVEQYVEAVLSAMDSPLEVRGATPCPVVIGAMGPMMLRLAGALAGGTVTAKAGVRTLGSYIVPRVNDAARQAGKPPPRIAACLPLCVTQDVEGAYERAIREVGSSERFPSYQRMLAMEGLARPADVAIIGDETVAEHKIRALFDAGITDFLARPFGTDAEKNRSLEFLGSLCRAATAS